MDVSTARAARGLLLGRLLCGYLLLLGGCRSVPSAVELPAATAPAACRERVLPVSWTTTANGDVESEPGPPASQEATAFTVAGAIDYGLRNNPRLRQASARVDATQAGETIAFAPFLPEFATSYRYSGFNAPVLPGGTFVPASLNAGVYSFSLAEAGVQWTLYDFGRTAGRYGQAVSRTRLEQLNLLRARQTIAFEVARAAFRLLSAQAALRVREQALKQAESIFRDTRTRRENGVADNEAVLRAEVEVSQAEEERLAAQQGVLDAKSLLSLAMGQHAPLLLTIENVAQRPEFALTLEECLRQAIDGRAEIEAARAAVAEAAYGIEAARGELLPKLFIRGTVARVDSPGPLEGWITGAGIHFEQPLYSGGRHKAEVRRARASVAATAAGLQVILDNISNQVNLAYQAIATNRQRIRLGEIAVAQARENLRLTLVKYRNSNATPTDLVDAQTALTRVETRFQTAVYDYLESLALLDYTLGGSQERWQDSPVADARDTQPLP